MRTRQLSIAIGAYSDGTWHIATVMTTYERGRLTGSTVLASREITEQDVEDQALEEVRAVMRAEETARMLHERRVGTHSPDAP